MEKTKREGYLVGLYFGDGYLYHHKKSRHYTIEFYLNSIKDHDILEKLERILSEMGHRVFVSKDKRGNWFRVRVNSKKLFSYLVSRDFTSLKWESKSYQLGFISGFIDAEGYVGNGTILVVNTNFKLLQVIQSALLSFGINSSLKQRVRSKKDKKDSYRLLVSTQIKGLPHNSSKILREYAL